MGKPMHSCGYEFDLRIGSIGQIQAHAGGEVPVGVLL